VNIVSRTAGSSLTAVQLEIMNLFWEEGELGVAQVWKLLSSRRPVARNTVQTTLTRLVEKGWLRSRAEGNTFYFRAARPRKSTLRALVTRLVDTAFGGSASGLVMTLLESGRISIEEAERIRQVIDRAPRRKL
jgi:predicted transcriptional regulator